MLPFKRGTCIALLAPDEYAPTSLTPADWTWDWLAKQPEFKLLKTHDFVEVGNWVMWLYESNSPKGGKANPVID